MNKRIKQIEEQCYIKPGGYYPGSDWPVPFFDKQKFAELIVQECKENFAKVWYEQGLDIQGAELAKFLTRFEKHFGVEE
jgi:hypothetical protein